MTDQELLKYYMFSWREHCSYCKNVFYVDTYQDCDYQDTKCNMKNQFACFELNRELLEKDLEKELERMKR